MWNGWQMTPELTWFINKAELQRENDSKSGWKCFLVLIVSTCSATGALGAAECQVMKWEMDRSEVKVRPEKKKKAGKQKSPSPTQSVKWILYLCFLLHGILQMSQLWDLNFKHIFMNNWADVRADCSGKQGDLIFPSASFISLLTPCQQSGYILSLTFMRFSEYTKTTENYLVVWRFLFCFFK